MDWMKKLGLQLITLKAPGRRNTVKMENKVSSSTSSRRVSRRGRNSGSGSARSSGVVVKQERNSGGAHNSREMQDVKVNIKTESVQKEEPESPTTTTYSSQQEEKFEEAHNFVLPATLDAAHTEIIWLRKNIQYKDIQLNVLAEKVYLLESQRAVRNGLSDSDEDYSEEEEESATEGKPEEPEETPKASTSGARRKRTFGGAPPEENGWLGFSDDVLMIVLKKQVSNHYGINWTELSSILRECRLVCRTWKKSVDRFLQEDLSHMRICTPSFGLLQYRQQYSLVSTHLSSQFPKEEAQRIQNFMDFYLYQQDLDPSYNPLPNQHLFIQCYRLSKNADDLKVTHNWTIFSEAVEQFIEMFGGTIRSLTLAIDMQGYLRARKPSHLLPMYRSFCDWLRLLPKLKSLALITCNDQSKYMNVDGKRQNLDDLLFFPTLKNLAIFQSTQLSSFAQSLLKKNDQVHKLYLGDSEWPLINSGPLENLNLPNLLECVLHINRSKQKTFAEKNGKLKSETLTICFHDKNVSGLMLHVPFTSTVVNLTLEQKVANEGDTFNEQVLTAPFLKELTIKSQKWEEIDWHRFLSGATLLETVNVEMSTKRRQPIGNCWVDDKAFWAYMRSIQHGTYWYFLPHLKNFNFVLSLWGTSEEPLQNWTQSYTLERYGMGAIEFEVKVKNVESEYFLNFK